MPWPHQTHTVVELPLTRAAYDEIAEALRRAGYDHVFLEGGLIDMTGIGVARSDEPDFTHAQRLERVAESLRKGA